MAAPPLVRVVATCVIVAGLAACPTVDTGEVPVTPGLCRPDKNEFRREGGIWDVAIAPADQTKSCLQTMGCHATQDGRTHSKMDHGVNGCQARRSRSALPTTDTELSDIAAAANSGDNRIPKNG